MLRTIALLVLAAPLVAQTKDPLDELNRVRLEGARKVAALAAQKARMVRAAHESGQRTQEEALEAARFDLDAQLAVAALEEVGEQGTAREVLRMTKLVPMVRKIAEIETQRRALAQKSFEAGKLTELKLLKRQEAADAATLRLTFHEKAAAMKDPPRGYWTLNADRKWEQAKLRKAYADRRVKLLKPMVEQGKETVEELLDARIQQAKADTAVTSAEIGRRMAQRMEQMAGR
ncbi:MAG: hypothetical protein AAGD14_10530 [Planctomycetota bacterium]